MTAKTVLRAPSEGECALTVRQNGEDIVAALPGYVLDRILERVTLNALTGCWRWTAAKDQDGYGLAGFAGRQFRVHRLVYQAARGPLPRTLHIDHLCKVRSCVNPLHLEAVLPLVNLFRGESPAVLGMKRQTCIKGHPFDFVDSRGLRKCRTCAIDVKRRYRARHHVDTRAGLGG